MSGDTAPRSPWEMMPGADGRPAVERPPSVERLEVAPGAPGYVPYASGPGGPFGPDGSGQQGGGRKKVWILGGVAAVVLLAYGGAAYAASGRVPKDTTVAGVDVGGLSRADAERKLRAAAEGAAGGLPVTVEGKAATLDVAAAKLTVDPAATVGELTGFSLDPRAIWSQLGGGGTREAVPQGGSDTLDRALTDFARTTGTPPKDATVTFAGATSAVTPAVTGTSVDVPRAAGLIRESWLAGKGPLALPTTKSEPGVTQAEAEAAQTEIAKPALAGPLSIVVGSTTVSLTPEKFSGTLAVKPNADGELELAVDGTKLREVVLKDAPQIGVVPKDASFKLQGGKPVVVPAVEGVTLDPASLAASVAKALAGEDRRAEVKTEVKQPELTTAKAQALGVKERVSTFSTNLTADSKRTENLRVAARTVNGTVVLPGETFSLNGVLGQRTAAKGYNQAPAINNGRLVRDFGGGVSQMATTIFNNVFFAGLQDVYHKPHSFYISRYPEGREATVNWPTVDLKWKNDSPHAVLIEASVGNKVNVSFWSTKRYDIEATKSSRRNFRSPETHYDDKPSCVTQEANQGFDVTVGRVFKQNGRVVKRESFNTTYIAEDKVICGPKPKAEGTPPTPGPAD